MTGVEPMHRAAVEAALREILREYVRHPERPIVPGDHLIFDLEILDDDLDDLISGIHRRFGIDPPGAAWSSAATFADVVALVERYRREPATAEERARDQAERRAAAHEARKFGTRVLAVLSTAAGLQLAGGPGAALLGVAFGAVWISRVGEGRRLRRQREAWKARRANA